MCSIRAFRGECLHYDFLVHCDIYLLILLRYYSRVLVQNNELKNQLAELQDGFVKMVETLCW